ncbi:MAG: N-acetylmuramoyl-L-alanine amidase [Butyrivibrio sp.]|nr:N-acetylmuramoyl-L-alanine amidase [Butyrivibrio sp.]
MKLIQNYLTQSGCYQAGRTILVKGLMIHSVGCPQAKASAFMCNWNKPGATACVHAIVEPGGDVYQTLPWNHRGWHCGGNGNNTHIGVEMTEPATIRYTGGAGWTEAGDGRNTREHVLSTYHYAVELFAYLCVQYGLDPLADGVVISHSEGYKRGIASNHGDVEHLWSKFGLSMAQFRRDIKAAMEAGDDTNASSGGQPYTEIMGKAAAGIGQMVAYLKGKNPPVAQSVLDMLPLYLSEGEAEGVRGDIAFAQSCLETGNFTFSGSAVTLGQNNFCGMGVTGNGMKGNSFDTPQLGIRAQVQHLKAYACGDSLVNACVDPRFRYVMRGCAPYVEWLGILENPQGRGWAAGAGYGGKVLSILDKVLEMPDTGKEDSTYTVRKNDTLWSIAAGQLGNGRRYKEIKELNGLSSDVIFAGQVLKLPD